MADEARQWIGILLWLAVLAWVGGLKLITDQDSKMERLHGDCKGVHCRPVGREVMWKICGGNIIMSLLAVSVALGVAIIIARVQ